MFSVSPCLEVVLSSFSEDLQEREEEEVEEGDPKKQERGRESGEVRPLKEEEEQERPLLLGRRERPQEERRGILPNRQVQVPSGAKRRADGGEEESGCLDGEL